MSISKAFGPAMMADSAINNWAYENWLDINSGAWPGLSDMSTLFKSLLNQPMMRQPGGGVGNMQYQNELVAGQYPGARARLATNAADLGNVFAGILEQGATSEQMIRNLIDSLRNQQQSGLDSLFGPGGGLIAGSLGITP